MLGSRVTTSNENPQWTVEKMPRARVMGDMTLLPNGDVLLINSGSAGSAAWELGRERAWSRTCFPFSPAYLENSKTSSEDYVSYVTVNDFVWDEFEGERLLVLDNVRVKRTSSVFGALFGKSKKYEVQVKTPRSANIAPPGSGDMGNVSGDSQLMAEWIGDGGGNSASRLLQRQHTRTQER
ncbi:hypothetical protein YC2023_099374 [Brassica napus]